MWVQLTGRTRGNTRVQAGKQPPQVCSMASSNRSKSDPLFAQIRRSTLNLASRRWMARMESAAEQGSRSHWLGKWLGDGFPSNRIGSSSPHISLPRDYGKIPQQNPTRWNIVSGCQSFKVESRKGSADTRVSGSKVSHFERLGCGADNILLLPTACPEQSSHQKSCDSLLYSNYERPRHYRRHS